MTVSHVWLFRKNTAGIPVFYRMHCLERSNLSCQQPSSYRRGLHLPVSNYMSIYWNCCIQFHKTATTTRNETDARLETKRVEIFNKHCLFAPSVKQYSRNIIASKYHYHAPAYSLQTVCCRFIYLHEENSNAADTDNWSRLPG